MRTYYLKIDTQADSQNIEAAAGILKNGGLVAIPTETVYGLAANALDGKAVAKIFEAKGRPQDNPLIVHIAAFQELDALVTKVPPEAVKLADAFWPGPLTIVLPKSSAVPPEVSAGLDTVAVRMPSHPVALRIIQAAGVPLAAPSANTSGSPSPTSAQHVLSDLDGKIDAVVDGGRCTVGVESTVLSLTGETPRILRPGGITPDQVKAVIGAVDIDPAVFSSLRDDEKPMSPGLKYKHYAPRAKVVLLKGSLAAFADYAAAYANAGTMAMCFNGEESAIPVPAVAYGDKDNAAEQAEKLFGALREADRTDAGLILVRCPRTEGIGLAVFNRLLRAAAFEVVEL